jgi:hypothetical protein
MKSLRTQPLLRNGQSRPDLRLAEEEEMVTYYRSPLVLITDWEFRSDQPWPGQFCVRDLRDVSVTVGRADQYVGRPPGMGGLRWNRTVWELRARYHGRPVLLYCSIDEQTFGQVKRALIRALEANLP